MVKCLYCGKEVDTEYSWSWKKVGKRYAHDECYEIHTKNEDDIKMASDKIKIILGDAYIKAKVEKQLQQYINEGKSCDNVVKTLEYWYDVKKEDPFREQSQGGIGIVGYIYNEAMNYYNEKDRLESLSNNVSQEQIDNMVHNNELPRRVCEKRVKVKKPKRTFYF